MEPDRRPQAGSIVVRESPNGGGALLYLARDAGGRAVWVRDVDEAEVHATMREANRAALLAPASAGAHRPAYAVPASILRPELSAATVVTPATPVVAPAAPDAAEPASQPIAEPAAATVAAVIEPEAPASTAPAGLWAVWSLWVETWMAFLFRQERRTRPLP
jgi:hypothetical protein